MTEPQTQDRKITAQSLFDIMATHSGEDGNKILAELDQELKAQRDAKIKDLMKAGAAKHENLRLKLSRLRLETAKQEAKLKKGMAEIVELSQKLLDGGQAEIDAYEIEVNKAHCSADASVGGSTGHVDQSNVAAVCGPRTVGTVTCRRALCTNRVTP